MESRGWTNEIKYYLNADLADKIFEGEVVGMWVHVRLVVGLMEQAPISSESALSKPSETRVTGSTMLTGVPPFALELTRIPNRFTALVHRCLRTSRTVFFARHTKRNTYRPLELVTILRGPNGAVNFCSKLCSVY